MQSQQLVGLNFCLGKAGLTGLSGAATTFTTANAFNFSINGKAFAKAAVAGGATPNVDFITGLPIILSATALQGKGTVVVWCVDAGGVVRAVQGTTENIDASGNFLTAAPQFPAFADNLTVFAYSIHKAAAGAAPFTFGVSVWNLAGLSHTLADLITLPSRPQVL